MNLLSRDRPVYSVASSSGHTVAASTSAYAWLPFGAALVLVLAAPSLNLLWSGYYNAYYKENYENPYPIRGQLQAGAEWAVDVASAVPNCALTLIGVILLDPPISAQFIAVVCLVVVIVVFGVTLSVAHNQDLTERRRTLRNRYSLLGWLQIFLNLAGLIVAIIWG